VIQELNNSQETPFVVIAIDGPAGAGKTTIARNLAKRLRFCMLDSGALYRTVALALLQAHELAGKKPVTVGVFDQFGHPAGMSPLERASLDLEVANEFERVAAFAETHHDEEWRKLMRRVGRLTTETLYP